MPFGGTPKPSPVEMSRKLREKALQVQADELGLETTEELPDVWGVIMDLGYEEAVASLAVFAEGSASLYISTGGGVIGAGEHPPVRLAAENLLMVAQEHLGELERGTDTALPRPGRVRFYIRTFAGTLWAEADGQDLAEHRHELAPLFHAGHAVITQMRLESERREAERG